MFRFTRILSAAALAVSAVWATPSLAQSTWNYATFTENTTNAGSYGNSYSTTQSGVKLTVSAYSTTGNSGTTFAAANLANYGSGSGFGVRSQTEGLSVSTPNHSMDNFTNTDMLALNFTNSSTAAAVSVVLSSLTTGWHNTGAVYNCGSTTVACGIDSDVSLLRWTKSTGPTITGGTIASLLTAGWELVNNYANMVDDTARATGAADTQASSWWLISAYNSAWGTGSNTANLSNGDDFVKVLASITTAPPQSRSTVSEPGSLALVGLAMAGAVTLRRRSAKTA